MLALDFHVSLVVFSQNALLYSLLPTFRNFPMEAIFAQFLFLVAES